MYKRKIAVALGLAGSLGLLGAGPASAADRGLTQEKQTQQQRPAMPDSHEEDDYEGPEVIDVKVNPNPVVLHKGETEFEVKALVYDPAGVESVEVTFESPNDYYYFDLDYVKTRSSGVEVWTAILSAYPDTYTDLYTVDVDAYDYDYNATYERNAGSFSVKLNTVLSFNASPEGVDRSGRITLAGHLDRLSRDNRYVDYTGKTVYFQFKPEGSSDWTTISKTTTTNSSGDYARTVGAARGDGTWRAVFKGTGNYASARSGGDFIDVT